MGALTSESSLQSSTARSPLAALHLSFFFSGAGTLLLGPTLPLFAERWHLQDSQSGLLIAAQFFGLFVGAIALSRDLRRTLLRGFLIAALGFLLLSVASREGSGYTQGIVAFFVLGLGLGHITTTVNLLSAQRYRLPQQRSAALSLLNATWSAGAVAAPLIAGFSIVHGSLTMLLLTMLGVAIVLFCAAAWAVSARAAAAEGSQSSKHPAIAWRPLFFVFALFFLYGGFEATLSGWLSTYSLRYTQLGLAAAAYISTTMWAAFAVGRAFAGMLLRYAPERAVRAAGIFAAMLATIVLRGVHTGWGVAACALLIGFGIAPFFPVTFSILISRRPRPRQAGASTANIGLGSAVFPYLTGLLSTHVGSLHVALLMPIGIALALLILCSFDRHDGEELSPAC